MGEGEDAKKQLVKLFNLLNPLPLLLKMLTRSKLAFD